jgi:hypothetical protein
MNGEIAQIIALTCHGNAALAGQDVGKFFPDNSTCAFCDRVTFVAPSRSIFGLAREKVVAKTPQDWFAHLKSTEATGIRAVRQSQNDPQLPDHRSVAFAGGGETWFLLVRYRESEADAWLPLWTLWAQWKPEAAEQRIWRVTYGRLPNAPATGTEPVAMHTAMTRLRDALREIRAFSAKHGLDHWTHCFDDALDTLESEGELRHRYYPDLTPPGCLSTQALRLLDACQTAWVFGGMGSWNDLLFDGAEGADYQRVSNQLFQSLSQAIAAGANDNYSSNLPRTSARERGID